MSFVADTHIGETPFVVQFTDSTSDAVGWDWDFGDSTSSEEQSPEHTYYVPGVYTIVLIVTYADLSQETFTMTNLIIAVQGETTAEVNCLRFATEMNEGLNWSIFSGSNWISPMDNNGIFGISDDNNIDRILCFDKTDFRVWEVDTCNRVIYDRPSPVDKEGLQNTEISWEKKEGERVFSVTEEYKFISHDRSYVNVRPEEKRLRGAVGYTDSGLRNAQQLTLNAYVDGEQTSPAATATNFPESGEVVFSGRKVKDNRVQMSVSGTASEILVLNHVHKFLGSDEAKETAKRLMAEHTYQRNLSTDLVVNIGRGITPLLNKVSGETIGTATRTTGPDGKRSGIVCDEITLDNSTVSTYTAIIWIYSGAGFSLSDMITYNTNNGWAMKYKRSTNLSASQVIAAGTYAFIKIYSKQLSDNEVAYLYSETIAGGRTC